MTTQITPATSARRPVSGAAQLICAAIFLPVLLLSALVWFAVDDQIRGVIFGVEMIYGALVLSFLAGARLGYVIPKAGFASLIFSLALMIIGWLVLFASPSVSIALLIAAFLCLSLGNYLSVQTGHIDQRYARLSLWLSLGTIMCLLAVWILLYLHVR